MAVTGFTAIDKNRLDEGFRSIAETLALAKTNAILDPYSTLIATDAESARAMSYTLAWLSAWMAALVELATPTPSGRQPLSWRPVVVESPSAMLVLSALVALG